MATAKAGYHHGDLRAALLRAAEAELAANGAEGFSLRACARRAGVSHAAPQHHFGTADGLLDALAVSGFERMWAGMAGRIAQAGSARERLVASGVGYVAFARENPALFKLMFSQRRAKAGDPALAQAAAAAFAVLQARVREATGAEGDDAERERIDTATAWAAVHGLSHLLIEGSPAIVALMGEAPGDEAVRRVLERTFPL